MSLGGPLSWSVMIQTQTKTQRNRKHCQIVLPVAVSVTALGGPLLPSVSPVHVHVTDNWRADYCMLPAGHLRL